MKKNPTKVVIGSIAIARPGLTNALQLARYATRRKPTEADRPPPSTFPGGQPRHIAGQLALGEEADDAA